jgi:hypothetical protein
VGEVSVCVTMKADRRGVDARRRRQAVRQTCEAGAELELKCAGCRVRVVDASQPMLRNPVAAGASAGRGSERINVVRVRGRC